MIDYDVHSRFATLDRTRRHELRNKFHEWLALLIDSESAKTCSCIPSWSTSGQCNLNFLIAYPSILLEKLGSTICDWHFWSILSPPRRTSGQCNFLCQPSPRQIDDMATISQQESLAGCLSVNIARLSCRQRQTPSLLLFSKRLSWIPDWYWESIN